MEDYKAEWLQPIARLPQVNISTCYRKARTLLQQKQNNEWKTIIIKTCWLQPIARPPPVNTSTSCREAGTLLKQKQTTEHLHHANSLWRSLQANQTTHPSVHALIHTCSHITAKHLTCNKMDCIHTVHTGEDDDEVMLNVLRCQLTY